MKYNPINPLPIKAEVIGSGFGVAPAPGPTKALAAQPLPPIHWTGMLNDPVLPTLTPRLLM